MQNTDTEQPQHKQRKYYIYKFNSQNDMRKVMEKKNIVPRTASEEPKKPTSQQRSKLPCNSPLLHIGKPGTKPFAHRTRVGNAHESEASASLVSAEPHPGGRRHHVVCFRLALRL